MFWTTPIIHISTTYPIIRVVAGYEAEIQIPIRRGTSASVPLAAGVFSPKIFCFPRMSPFLTMHTSFARFGPAKSLRVSFFTRANCSLCSDAKRALQKVQDRRPFHYEEIDIMLPTYTRWRDLYDFDVPVVCLSGDLVSYTQGSW